MSEEEIHPAGTSQGENDSEEVRAEMNEGDVTWSLRSKMREGAQKVASLSSACIFRVPKEIRKLNESAYTPRLIAIGPLHRNDPHLQTSMQHFKTSYMNKLLCRMTHGMGDQEAEQKKITVLVECLAAMEMSIEDAKKCYAEEVTLDAEMMLIDGCFILELLYQFYIRRNGYRERGLADPIFANDLTIVDVEHDLLLLENQIPFFVLGKLYSLTLAQIPTQAQISTLPITNLSLTDFVFLPHVAQLLRPANNSEPEAQVSSRIANYHHILHKLHDDFLPHDKIEKGELSQYMPCASELLYAGIKFVSGTGNDLFQVKFTEPEGLFRWWFRSGRLEIPPFKIFDMTEPYLRNFIAFEQSWLGSIPMPFTSYAAIMDMLVNSDIDVQVLEKAGIIDNWLGASEDASNLFKNLGKGILLRDFFFADQINRAIKYSKCFWPKNKAYLRSQYFASPWKFIAFCLAIVAFGVSIAILVFTILLK